MNSITSPLKLYLVLDPDFCTHHSPEAVADLAIQGGVSCVQLRSKTLSTRNFFSLATKLKKLTDFHAVPFLINDRADIALAVEASGVHVGPSDLHPNQVREILGRNAIIGFSASSSAEAKIAQAYPVDYLGVGPIFKTNTKADANPIASLDELKTICEFSKIPVVGIGGIDKRNLAQIVNIGASGIAVVSAICSQPDPLESAKALGGFNDPFRTKRI